MSSISPRKSPLSRWRTRTRAVRDQDARVEGTGGPGGIVLPLNMVGAGMYEAVYTVAVQVGSNNQNFSLQVDTGSSDLWIASTSCSSAACAGSKGRQYDPSASGVTTKSNFVIQYLAGKVSGPVYWDEVQIGGYSIDNQALASATSVDSEPLEREFNGILGLALPQNSLIAQLIPPVTGDGPDGATFSSNLFGITPVNSTPSSRFFSLALSRPGFSAPSLLGIGRHPSQLVPDPSQVKYSAVVQQNRGFLFWQVEVHAITLYVNGSPLSVNLDHPRSGNLFPTAVIDSGVPFILAESHIANGIYGALGIGPAADGQYYVPCNTAINMTVTFDGQLEIPLHPLDLTTQSQFDPSSSTCVGLIQTGGGVMDTSPGVSDMILGAAFMRNVYTVMSYDVPDAFGMFPNNSNPTAPLQPRVGFLSLTNATLAMEQFYSVRVLNQPASSGNASSPTSTSGQVLSSDHNKLGVGVVVLLALVAVIGACVSLFGLRWFLVRRQFRRSPPINIDAAETKHGGVSTTYTLARNVSFSNADVRLSSGMSIAANSARTAVGQDDPVVGEFGFRMFKDKDNEAEPEVSYLNLDPGDPSGWRDTLVGSTMDFPEPPNPTSALEAAMLGSDEPISSSRDAALAATPLLAPTHMQHASMDSTGSLGSISTRNAANDNGDDGLTEFGVASESMAGIGTAARSSRIQAHRPHASGSGSFASLGSMSPPSLGDLSPGTGPRHSARFLSIAPGERLSAYSLTEETALNTTPQPPPPS
ncbi:aspartic peptidase domain-containing protein [Russula earlei]|uniref:Aspartic peptidase domain-containing protein n=1 Tax=Russula earlei TaxID=71964 RepID=A0ACC0UEW6_9AGAM|nr:aspartic peptidase domain-containing protein [Russula earlei]